MVGIARYPRMEQFFSSELEWKKSAWFLLYRYENRNIDETSL